MTAERVNLSAWIAVVLLLVAYVQSANIHGGQFHGSGSDVGAKLGFTNSGCETLEMEYLSELLGPAYNPRYMSVIPPREAPHDETSDIKRKADVYNQFSVDGDFAQEVEEAPAWETDHFKELADESEKREKRSASVSRPWECQAVVKWIDLGMDYFPRYLRSVECTKHDCWYGKFTCKARSFTVKLLRRKKGKCVYQKRKEGVSGLPKELRELWVWEERAVNFCCDCAPP